MDLGIKMTNPASLTRDEALALVRRADRLGYHSIWVGERWGLDPFVTLTQLATMTQRIELATGVVNVFSRTPGVIAQAIASLDLVSKGRAVLGLGTSGSRAIEQWHGVPFDRPVQRTREYVQIIRLMLSGERADYDGELFKLERFRIDVRPVRERIPIFVAALGPRNLRMTGEVADGWLPAYVSPDRSVEQLGQVRRAAASAGREAGAIVVAPEIYVCVTEDRPLAERLTRDAVARSICGEGSFYGGQVRRNGFPGEVDAVLRLWRAGRRDQAAAGLPDAMVEAFAVIGPADECRARLERLHTGGWDLPIIRFPRGAPKEMIAGTIEALAPG